MAAARVTQKVSDATVWYARDLQLTSNWLSVLGSNWLSVLGSAVGFYEKGLEITGAAHSAGVRILLGTDSGDSYSFFGSGVHDELSELVNAGLSPAETLNAATLAAAEFLSLASDYGSVHEGKVADPLLLRENPLQQIDRTRNIEAIFFKGQYFDRAELDAMLEAVAESVAGM